jgi:3-methyladenine DNA glycosylase/8-oxoguanine DNA glycosylase
MLQLQQAMELIPTAPFNFDATMHKPDHFPSPDNDWEPGVRWQTMLWQGQPLGLKLENLGTTHQPRICLSIWSAEHLDQECLSQLTDELNHRYCLQLDLTDFDRRFESDPHLGPIVARWRGMRPMNCCSLYEYLMVAVVLQNATVRRSVNMMRALFEAYGSLLSYDGKDLYCFWQPEVIADTSEDQLRSLKVGYRAKSIKRITQAFVDGQINEFALRRETREEQRRALLELYGIGPASVQYILSDVFHHLDELDHISPWEQKIYSKLFFDTPPDDPVPADGLLAFFSERFAGYRMLAIHYFWEDLFWRKKTEPLEWLERMIRL